MKSGIGSGFIISKDGLILTNSHVVFGTQHIVVTLDNGNKVVGKLIGADPILDLAVLKIPYASRRSPRYEPRGFEYNSSWRGSFGHR